MFTKKWAVTSVVLTSFFMAGSVSADCVYGAKDKRSYSVIDNHTIILTGGFRDNIMIKTYCFIYNSSQLQVLKDSFCSHENAVLYIDGEVCDASQVQKLNN